MNQVNDEIMNHVTCNEVLRHCRDPILTQAYRRIMQSGLAKIKIRIDDSIWEELQEHEINSSKV